MSTARPSVRPSRLRALLFDLDGVLVDSRAPIAGSINFALRRHGRREWPVAALVPRIGDPLHAIFVAVLGEPAPAAELLASCIAAYREHYQDACLEETRAIPGIAEPLAALARRVPLGVATSKPVEFALPILERVGLRAHFAAIAGPGLGALEGEPKSGVARRALGELGFASARGVALVGDRHHDVEAALALGLHPIGVTWGIGSEDELRRAGAIHLLHHPHDLGTSLLA